MQWIYTYLYVNQVTDIKRTLTTGGIMEIREIIPLVLPGGIIQVLIQAYYIKHCWENKQLSQPQKVRYIISIVLFNILAAAIYLFLTFKRDADIVEELKDFEIDSQVKQGIFLLLVIAFEIFSLRIIAENLRK
jgi:hypothetical protein